MEKLEQIPIMVIGRLPILLIIPVLSGVSYKCFDVYFHPNVAAFNSIPNGTTIRLENIFRQNSRNQTGTTTLIVSRDNSINLNWRE